MNILRKTKQIARYTVPFEKMEIQHFYDMTKLYNIYEYVLMLPISNQSILKEISPGCSLEGMMLKLKLQYFEHLMRRVDSLEKTLMLGGIGGRRRRG